MAKIANKMKNIAGKCDYPLSAEIIAVAAEVEALEDRMVAATDEIYTLRTRLRLAQACYERATEVWS